LHFNNFVICTQNLKKEEQGGCRRQISQEFLDSWRPG